MPPTLSVLIPTFNNQDTIAECLDAVRWADEIVVVDSFSTDGTRDCARACGARVLEHEYIQSAKQKNWAIPQCAGAWVLQLDTDERLEEGAYQEIRDVLAQVERDVKAFRIPRKNHILGEWLHIANLYPDYQTRLFRRDVGRFEDKEVHAHVRVPGRVGTLHHAILHYGMTSLSHQLRNQDRYTRYQADELKKRGKRFHWWQLLFRPPAIFCYYLLWRRGFTAGYRGFYIAALNASFDFWAHAKLWEMETFGLEASPK